MDVEVRALLEQAEKACVSFLAKFEEGDSQKNTDNELAPILDCMVEVARAYMKDDELPPGNYAIHLASREIDSASGKAVAHVAIDQYKKLQLCITPLCPTHGADCRPDMEDQEYHPRSVSLHELSLIGISGTYLIRSLHDFLSESLVETMISMKGPTEAC